MNWDSNRPVPWARLVREWLIYMGIMAVVLLAFFRDDNIVGLVVGILVSGPIFIGLGAVMAKFGYQRRSLADMRTPRASVETAAASPAGATGPRPRPAPTKRTSTGRGNSRRKR